MPTRPTKKRRPPKKRAVPELISRSELARRKGVSRSTAYRACNGRLSAAMVGSEVDAAHPEVVAWIAGEPSLLAPESVAPTTTPTREDFALISYRKRLAEAERIESRNRRDAGRLIERERVRTHVFSYLERLHLHLLAEMPLSLSSRVAAGLKSGASNEEVVTMIRDAVSHELLRTQEEALRALRAIPHAPANPMPTTEGPAPPRPPPPKRPADADPE